MIRSQIYLTDKEKKELNIIARRSGKKQSELIRLAIDQLIKKYQEQRQSDMLDQFAGIWKDRDDLPDFARLRQEWDRI